MANQNTGGTSSQIMIPGLSPRVNAIAERMVYVAVGTASVKFVQWGWITSQDVPWITAGIMTALATGIGWWKTRPARMVQAAANSMPDNTKLVMQIAPAATPAQAEQVRAINDVTSNKVQAVQST